ncbi:inter-alpha-trypsin inhibitor heavy chain H3-like isoform X11 [Apostichopus japonicus]|uniref:inter-alpha-trypsin inhibitor heavy chain H3-like isoform X11 n=1 Tax=Stichopus japonicus TaxID=307972 RepID=UPI003AB581AB
MKLLLPSVILFSVSNFLGICSASTWQINQALEQIPDINERYERNVQGSGSGDLSGEGPCSDDEDSPCSNGRTTMDLTSYPAPRIRSLNVETTITARYVSTTVITEIENQANVSQDSDFRFRLSKGAFISDFFMVIKGRVYQADVREKEEAQKAYNEARRQGLTAGQVKQSSNDQTKFETNVNLSPNTTATFHLSFQEQLRRKNGVFQHKVNLFPKEIVKKLRADVYITEPQGISFANISWEQDDSLTTDFLYDALTVNRRSDTKVHAWFNPSHWDQEGLSEMGLQGDLVITYDVVHDSGAGHIEVVNGYFVHHISPEGLPITPKNVIFVIDISGSMNGQDGANYGSKIDQTKVAMTSIIDQIRDFDHFNIICFSDYITRWNTAVVEATPENKMAAKQFVDSLQANGGTDIHGGLMDAIIRLKELEDQNVRNALSMIILLTDGEPTSGITNPSEIVESITKAIDGKIALLSLAFGASADYELLQKLSGHNQGLARKIYSDSSPSLQLDGFYKEVATPILYNVDVQYPENAVEMDTLTKTNFISYFQGTEIVIAGKLKDDYEGNELSALVVGNSFDVQLEWGLTKTIESHLDKGGNDTVLKPHQVDDFAQRLWAYVTIKELLAQLEIALTADEKNSIRDKATGIALKYKFVTPLTSLIVIKPDDEENYDDILETETEEEHVPINNAQAHGISQPQSIGASSLPLPAVASRSYSYSAPQRLPQPMSVDGDPHVFVTLPKENISLCFEITGEDGMMINLMSDEGLDIYINAVIHSVSEATGTTIKSFFTAIGLNLGRHALIVTPRSIKVEGGLTMDWKIKSRMAFDGFILRVDPAEKVLEINNMKGVSMYVRRHSDIRTKRRVGSRKHKREEHLGLYIQETSGFTESLGGILGQFYSTRHEFRIEPAGPPDGIPDQNFGNLTSLIADGTKIPVVWHEKNQHTCWHAGKGGHGNLDPALYKTDTLI